MSRSSKASASFPPPGLYGLDPQWSRLVTTPGIDETGRTWHILDNWVGRDDIADLTLLCIHGNPTWSYLWRELLSNAPPGVRVVAIDQLDMGFSERTGRMRRFAQRIDDLDALTDELDLRGPIVVVAHDWGGVIALGWAERHVAQLGGIVLTNTAVHQPEDASAPNLIRLVRLPGFLGVVGKWTPVFLWGTMALARPRLKRLVRRGYRAPYRGPSRRQGIANFVRDIPLSDKHPTLASLDKVAADLYLLRDVPTLLLWGPSDPIFSDMYLRDLTARLPHAKVHRFIGAGHMVAEDADISSAISAWLDQLDARPVVSGDTARDEPLWAALDRRSTDDDAAIVEMGADGVQRSISFADLAADVSRVAAGLVDMGVSQGDRVSLLIPPGINLAVCVYACWRMGAIVVIVDAGLGPKGMGVALKSANPQYMIGIPKALAAAKVLRWPGVRICSDVVSETRLRMLGAVGTLDDVRARGEGKRLARGPEPDADAAVLFTSGSTGPAKGVLYRHRQLQAQRDAIVELYGIKETDRLVAAFGPFALFGPGIGITSAVPDMDTTSPGTLTARALAEAVKAVDATMVFGSPAALRNVVATADEMPTELVEAMEDVRLLISVGAPVPAEVLRAAVKLMPNAEAHTPYGMTEVLPVADIALAQIESAGGGTGVCVGHPVSGVEVAISALDGAGEAVGSLTTDAGVVGEVCISARHIRDGYDNLWLTQHAASDPIGWHRSGDVGHLDAQGRLWVEGRLAHLIRTGSGPVTPIGIEHRVLTLPNVKLAAAVGVGPAGAQVVVVVVELVEGGDKASLADESLAAEVRSVVNVDVAAVLVVPRLPTDLRHNSKIDRTRVAAWAEDILAGGRVGKL